MRPWEILGVRSGWGAQNMGAADGPKVLWETMPPAFRRCPWTLSQWHGEVPVTAVNPRPLPPDQAEDHRAHIFEMVKEVSRQARDSILTGNRPLILGGDHSIAIGTWSGVKSAIGAEDLGLLWIDAHMDAHTPQTTPSRNIHGMPVAALLGQGDAIFTSLTGVSPAVKPQNLCLMGVRSFEEGEAALLAALGVRVYFMDEIRTRGFQTVFQEARQNLAGCRFGVSLDVDAFDPEDAPGTGTREPFGLRQREVAPALEGLAQDADFLALEIMEFNPHRDDNQKTARLIWQVITAIAGNPPYDH